MNNNAVAFLSYVQFDDTHEDGRITKLREALSREVKIQTGEDFPIFQDKKDIKWGDQWHKRIVDSIDASSFLIPILSPSYFKRPACREELGLFLEREKLLGRSDLILPIYYIQSDLLDSGELQLEDPLAYEIVSRQYCDWRGLRFESLDSNLVRKKISELASQICEAKKRIKEPTSVHIKTGSHQKGNKVHIKATEEEIGSIESIETQSEQKAVTIYTVDPLHRGHFSTIGDAIAAAKPGDIIHVMPGLYTESIKMDKPLEIIGQGLRDEIVVESYEKSALIFDSNIGRVSNMILRQKAGEKVFCITIRQGRLMLEDCDISSQVLSCIGIFNNADPRIRNNRIHSSKQSGVFFYGDSTGRLEDNEIFGNTYSGIAIKEGANPVIRRNKIKENDTGISVFGGGKGRIEENEVSNNSRGMHFKGKANPFVFQNTFQRNETFGISVHDEAKGLIEGNIISYNGLSGIEVKGNAHTTCRDNEIHNNIQCGIYINVDGKGLYLNNRIHHNGFDGFFLNKAVTPIIRRNQISDNVRNGIVVSDGSGTIDNNNLVNNNAVGIHIKNKADIQVIANEVTGNMQGGVLVAMACKVSLVENRVSANTGYNLKSETSSEVVMKNNQIDEP